MRGCRMETREKSRERARFSIALGLGFLMGSRPVATRLLEQLKQGSTYPIIFPLFFFYSESTTWPFYRFHFFRSSFPTSFTLYEDLELLRTPVMDKELLSLYLLQHGRFFGTALCFWVFYSRNRRFLIWRVAPCWASVYFVLCPCSASNPAHRLICLFVLPTCDLINLHHYDVYSFLKVQAYR